VEIKLSFKITFVSGEQTVQEISLPADPNKAFDQQAKFLMQQMLGQYATVGMIRQPEPGTFVLLCPSQIAMVECTLPSIVIASPNEIPPAPKVTLD
jgi:hypothetical protein